MRLAIFLLFFLGIGRLHAAERNADPPETLYQELFSAVAEQSDPDSRTLATAIPLQPPADILARYRAEKPATPEALKAFVAAHFSQPVEPPAPAIQAGLPLDRHIDALWDVLTRHAETVPDFGSLLPLPHPYVVPGGRFVELYYWDSYFTLLGLQASGRGDLAEGMVDDFAYVVDRYGHIPNGSRSYYLSRSQPPFFFKMAELIDPSHPAHYLKQLKAEYAFWMEGAEGLAEGQARGRVVALPGGVLLNRYWDDRESPRDEAWRKDVTLAKASGRDPARFYRDIRAGAESGWDFSSRWFEDGKSKATIITSEILPVDLNSLMYGLEKAISAGCLQVKEDCAEEFSEHASRRRKAIDRFFWSARDGAYFDYRWSTGQPIERLNAATFAPLFVQAASPAQAAAVARTARHSLLKQGGLVTTPIETGEQWDAPNGWAPLQWIAIDGLRRYKQDKLAASIACHWIAEVAKVYGETGKLFEKYDVVTDRPGGGGEYPLQDGFGWTNGVTGKLMTLYPACRRG